MKAVEARKFSYSPYSNFAVGACLQCDDDSKTLVTGCNVENAVFGLTWCAERTAIVKAISEGRRKYLAIAIIADQKDSITSPCGACRQFLAEFGGDIKVYMTRPTLGEVMVSTVKELLPYSFQF